MLVNYLILIYAVYEKNIQKFFVLFIFDSILNCPVTDEERVVIGDGVNFFCNPLRICCPFTDIVIYLLNCLLFFYSFSCKRIQQVRDFMVFLREFSYYRAQASEQRLLGLGCKQYFSKFMNCSLKFLLIVVISNEILSIFSSFLL